MFKKVRYLLVLTLLVAFFSVIIVDAQEVSTATKVDLVDSLECLRETMSKKIDCDIDITAQAFTDVKDYWRSKRWADIFTTPLRILEDTLSVLNKITYIKNLSKGTNAALNNSETLYQVLSIVMMYQDLQKVGEKLYWGLNGPNYVASIESMLEEADATFVPPFGDNWQKYYKEAIENYLYGTTEKIPIVIPRRSATAERKNIEFAKGASQVRSRVTRTFNDLIKEIESKELPDDFPVDEVIIQVKELTKQIHKSMSYNTDVEYKTNFQDHVKVKLGAVGEQYRAFGQVAGMVDKNLEIEQSVELLKFIESIGNAVLLYTITYKIPGAEEIKIAQKSTVLSELIINPYINTFYSDSEKVFYMLPQEMILSMPTELSNLWMIADDIDQYLRCFYQEIATPIITSSLKITPSSPYYVGDKINAEFTITNKDSIPITFSVLTVGGRDPDDQIADFTHRQNVTLEPSKSYNYQGTLTLNKVGDYHFFCTYQTPDGDWNTSVDLGSGLTDKDRIEDIVVKEKEKPPVPDIEWDKTFGGSEDDSAGCIIQTTDGGYAVAGNTNYKSLEEFNVWLIKLDNKGNLEWDKTFGGSEDDYTCSFMPSKDERRLSKSINRVYVIAGYTSSFIQTEDGGYAVAGYALSNNLELYVGWLIKLDNKGNLEWDKEYATKGAFSIIQTTDRGYAVAGCSLLIKLDNKGNLEWDKDLTEWDLGFSGGASSIIQTTDGGYAIAGKRYYSENENWDFWIRKLDNKGNLEWDGILGRITNGFARNIIQTTDGGYAVAGYTYINLWPKGSRDSRVIKLDNKGNLVWDKTFGGSEEDCTFSIIQTTDGGYAVVGITHSKGAGKGDIWVIKLDNKGNLVWDKAFGGSELDGANSIIQTKDGGYAVVGITRSKGAGKGDIWVIKLKNKKH